MLHNVRHIIRVREGLLDGEEELISIHEEFGQEVEIWWGKPNQILIDLWKN